MKKIFLIVLLITSSSYIIMFAQQLKIHNSKIKIQNAWARPAVKNANSALYFFIENKSRETDTLLGAQSKIAEEVEVHESFIRDNDRMGMRPAGRIAIKPNSQLEFKPGGFHVMLLGLLKDLRIGDNIEAVLLFKYAGKIKIKAMVSDIPTVKETKH